MNLDRLLLVRPPEKKNSMRRFFIHTQGQVLVETMVALSIVVIALLGMLSLLSNSLGINRVVADQYIGSYLAAEGVEVVKNILDTNVASGKAPNEGIANCANGCTFQYDSTEAEPYSVDEQLQFNKKTGLYLYEDGSNSGFHRSVKVSQDAAGDYIRVSSRVTWNSRGGISQEVELEDVFYYWR